MATLVATADDENRRRVRPAHRLRWRPAGRGGATVRGTHPTALDRDGRLDARLKLVIEHLEVLVTMVEQGRRSALDRQLG